MARKRKRSTVEYQVFLSHATADKGIAILIDAYLSSREIKTFRDDRSIEGGDQIPEVIREQIPRSRELLVLWTPQSQASRWVDIEITVAWGHKLRIVPILYMMEYKSLPAQIAEAKGYHLHEIEKCLHDITKRAKRSVS